ncbi:hypothetical protein CI109_107222 [Kwoniella shandongensis]|uniref:Mediator of RNA polymerase II transcription subunit 17 n=1 Tax=Kwoniella shandongensis TaxID=1734106 RepID=A0AAJ8LRV6_9TREE
MNGEASGPQGDVTAPFDDLRVSIDSATLDTALGKRKVRAIEPDGTLLYDEGQSVSDKLTEQLERVWNEYPNGLLDVTEEKLGQLLHEDDAIKPVEEDKLEEKTRDGSKAMEWDEMDKLRSEIYLQLNDARNELWFVLELAKTLAVSSSFTSQPPLPPNQPPTKKAGARAKPPTRAGESSTSAPTTSISGEPPVLPPGTYTTTPSAAPSKPTHAQVHELETVLAAKQKALDECSALIDSAVSELQLMASAGDRFWRDVRSLKSGKGGNGQWAVVPKPDFGRVMGEGEKAKDLIIPYAIDEGTRARCLAAFDLDPTKKDALTFGARHQLRLRVTLRDDSGAGVSSTPVKSEDASDVRETMEAAQMEAFDEDLFNELRGEASQIDKNVIEQRLISLPAASYNLSFELYEPRSAPSVTSSPLCDMVLSSARLGLLNVLRRRKSNLVSPTVSSDPPPSILQPIIDTLRYRQLCAVIHSTLQNFATTLNAAGVETRVVRRMIGADQSDTRVLELFLEGQVGAEILRGSFELDVAGCRGVIVQTSAPYNTTVRFPNATFPLSNPDELSHVLSEELSSQLLVWVNQSLQEKVSGAAGKADLFFDELEDVIDLANFGFLRISIPPPFHTVLGNLENEDVSEECKIEGFDARQGQSLGRWMDIVVDKMVAYSGPNPNGALE